MNPSDARSQLLHQHERLRRLVAAAEDWGIRLRRGEPVANDFRGALVELRDALTEHNQTEEALLEPLLPKTDAWGPARVTRMLEEHVAEHMTMHEALAGSEAEVAARMTDFAEDLLAHMAAEERTFLHPTALRDTGRR